MLFSWLHERVHDPLTFLILLNIFPGDLLFKNFGVNDQGKVVFYDYDEICYLSECNFRRIPPPRSSLDLFRDEPWYSVNPNDIFPEEFITFISTDPKIRKMLMELHPDLFDISSWQNAQESLAAGRQADVFPYPQKLRFSRKLQSSELSGQLLAAAAV
ncbi:MAG: hypothetical protein B6D71_14550 [gamma proteobacterium symbiont of Stewartia floridana]|nr:MAG: hypothetical protein B6D71_14550 [gamma proteobacterium symbiont of Stewartia floridana]